MKQLVLVALVSLSTSLAVAGCLALGDTEGIAGSSESELDGALVSAQQGRAAAASAKEQRGKPYDWGASGPDSFDDSGLTMYSWAQAGVSVPRSSSEQYAATTSVGQPQPGDLVFYEDERVAMYVETGHVIYARPRAQVELVDVDAPGTVLAVRRPRAP